MILIVGIKDIFNKLTNIIYVICILRETLENAVLNALQAHLMRDDLVQVFCAEYTKHMNELRSAQSLTLKKYKAEKTKLVKEREGLIQAIKDGIPAQI